MKTSRKMNCNYCPNTYMCQCPPKCVKCCKAATIYRSTLHVLHGRPQPQHSWPWEHRTPGTNDAVSEKLVSKLVPNFTPLSFSTTPFLTETLVSRNVSAQLKDLRNGSKTVMDQPVMGQNLIRVSKDPTYNKMPLDPYYAAQSEDNYKGIIVAKPKQNPLMIKKIPLMSLTLTREKKRRTRNKTRKVKRKIAKDLRLLLDEKKKQK